MIKILKYTVLTAILAVGLNFVAFSGDNRCYCNSVSLSEATIRISDKCYLQAEESTSSPCDNQIRQQNTTPIFRFLKGRTPFDFSKISNFIQNEQNTQFCCGGQSLNKIILKQSNNYYLYFLDKLVI